MNKPDIAIVDNQDSPIGSKSRTDIDVEDIYRVSALWLTDTETNKVLIAQRKLTKKNDPGKWSTAAAGTVEVGETYEGNMAKEIAEELGIKSLELAKGPKQFIEDARNKFFCQWFLASVNASEIELILQEDEVEAVQWVSEEWLKEDVNRHPQKYPLYLPASLQILTK